MKFLNEEGLRRVVSWIKGNYIDKVSGNNATLSFYKGDKKQDITIDNVNNATNADTAIRAVSATKAVQDKNGRDIVNTYAPLISPNLTGVPTAPTAGVDTNTTQVATTAFVRSAINKYAPVETTLQRVYPVGSIYMSTVTTNPAELFGFGTWEAMPAGRVLLAQGQSEWGTNYTAGSKGGEATHQLTVGEMPEHRHSGSISSAGEHKHAIQCKGESGASNGVSSWYARNWQRTEYTDSTGNHSHTVTINNAGNNEGHNNIQPYIAICIWKRIS